MGRGVLSELEEEAGWLVGEDCSEGREDGVDAVVDGAIVEVKGRAVVEGAEVEGWEVVGGAEVEESVGFPVEMDVGDIRWETEVSVGGRGEGREVAGIESVAD